MDWKDPEQVRNYTREYYAKNKEKRRESSRKSAKSRTRKRDASKLYIKWIKRQYNLTIEEYNKKLELQDYKCAICRKEFKRTPCVDHDHNTGQIRGLLCHRCNLTLGLVENIGFWQAIEEYKKRWMEYNGQHNSIC